MNPRENLLSLYRRTGYEHAPVSFVLCPELKQQFYERTNYDDGPTEYYNFPYRTVADGKLRPEDLDPTRYLKYYPALKPGTTIDSCGIGHQPGSAAAKHMTYMLHPLRPCESLSEMQEYPLPDFAAADYSHQRVEVDRIHARGLAACGDMQCTIWEKAWYIRGMEELMMDMVSGEPMAEYILDRTTEMSVIRATKYAEAGCDLLFLGDDVGMQRTPMMSMSLYCEWLKPRLKRVIDAARAVKPDIIVLYHSCGFVTPFIPHLIEAGIDVLNPVQPECMDFAAIHAEFGDRLSFNGTLGTQSVMPFGTPDEVRRKVFENLSIAGDKGGLFCCPTHMLEPEVPWANIEAYVRACEDFK